MVLVDTYQSILVCQTKLNRTSDIERIRLPWPVQLSVPVKMNLILAFVPPEALLCLHKYYTHFGCWRLW